MSNSGLSGHAAIRAATDSGELIARLVTLLGDARVSTGTVDAARYTDVYRNLSRPVAVVRPDTVEKVQEVVGLLSGAGVEIAVRGGGASYTDGFQSDSDHFVLLDLGDLNRIEAIEPDDGYVTVQAGATWADLKAELDKLDVRTPFFGPFSGLHATVGGSMSQHSISHGSGAYGTSAQSALCMDVVLADGSLLRTGSGALGAKPFLRHFGPDLTGLFCGDCGVFGVKVRVTLPLIRKRPTHGALSFAFDTFEAMHTSMRRISQEGLEDTHFSLDGALSQGQIAKQDRAGNNFGMALRIIRSSPSILSGIRQTLKSAVFARREISESPFMTHYIIEGVSDAEVRARIHRMREINLRLGHEITATVPAVVRGMPFAPFYNVLGPNGERWVPLHGVLAHSAVPDFRQALLAFFAERRQEMDAHEVWCGSMFSAVGSSGFLYELALYWPDELTDYHRSVLPPEYLDALTLSAANPEARQFVDALKTELTELFAAHHATFFQLGKAYPYAERLGDNARKLVEAIKTHLDPQYDIAPHSLGLRKPS